jgi:hypothetical protein
LNTLLQTFGDGGHSPTHEDVKTALSNPENVEKIKDLFATHNVVPKNSPRNPELKGKAISLLQQKYPNQDKDKEMRLFILSLVLPPTPEAVELKTLLDSFGDVKNALEDPGIEEKKKELKTFFKLREQAIFGDLDPQNYQTPGKRKKLVDKVYAVLEEKYPSNKGEDGKIRDLVVNVVLPKNIPEEGSAGKAAAKGGGNQ